MTPAKILVVEDDGEISGLLTYNLEKHGYEAIAAETGLAACRSIEKDRPDLILLDLMLPDFDGREVCKMIRATGDKAISSIPIVMLTAMAGTSDRVEGLALGADDYVTKPFSIEEVLLRVGKLLARGPAVKEEPAGRPGGGEEGGAMREFQEMVFHELSNQLLIVRGFSGRLWRNGEILPQDKIRSYAKAIYDSSTHLGSLAEEMLLLRTLQEHKGKLSRQEVLVAGLAGELRDLLAPRAEERGISLKVDVSEEFPQLFTNKLSLKIVLSCLLENAVKYGRPGGKVLLTAAVLADGSAAIYVEDDGVGIDPDEQDQVFEKFYRGRNIQAVTRGTGLGLYFAKTLTEAMGGEISLKSEPGNGSRFRVAFPKAAISEKPEEKTETGRFTRPARRADFPA